MNVEPLEAIGKYFEMPTKEAWLNKIDPTLANIHMHNFFQGSGFIFLAFIAIVGGFIAFLYFRSGG